MSEKATFVVGLQYGDEGKGKIVDLLAESHDVVIRGNGGSNAGHTIILKDGAKLALHQLPSGIAYDKKKNVIAHGMLLDPVRLVQEIHEAEEKGVDISTNNLTISTMCHLVFPAHKLKDAAREASEKGQGSTKAGIAFAASDKALREGVRAEIIKSADKMQLAGLAQSQLADLVDADEANQLANEFADAALKLKPYLGDTVTYVEQQLLNDSSVLVEGAQAFGLDINHGKYPYTTSCDTTVPGLLVGTGINHTKVDKVYGVAKAIPSKVGGGAFITKIADKEVAASTRGMKGEVDAEYGATTGREREVGYLDLVALKRAVTINGVDRLALTKFDCLNRHGKITKIAIAYNYTDESGTVQELTDPPASNQELLRCEPVYKTFETWGDITDIRSREALPKEAKTYLSYIEEYLGVPVAILGVGPERNQVILK